MIIVLLFQINYFQDISELEVEVQFYDILLGESINIFSFLLVLQNLG